MVTVEDCRERHANENARVDRLELALFGKDGRGGMVADVTVIKTKLEVATSIFRTIVIPIGVPVILALIGFYIGKSVH